MAGVGNDDGVCDRAPDLVHDFQLAELVVHDPAGLGQVSSCVWCGAIAYEASAADDPLRPPL